MTTMDNHDGRDPGERRPLVCGNDPAVQLTEGDQAAAGWFADWLAWVNLPAHRRAAVPEPADPTGRRPNHDAITAYVRTAATLPGLDPATAAALAGHADAWESLDAAGRTMLWAYTRALLGLAASPLLHTQAAALRAELVAAGVLPATAPAAGPVAPPAPASFTCPTCGRTSHHPQDVRNGYCGACHEFTGQGAPDA